MASLINIDNEKCKLCYSCVRTCPAKAIRVHDGVFDILDNLCISCGSCTTVCFQNAIITRSDKESVKRLLEKRNDVIAIVAPSISGEFSDITDYRSFVGMFKSLGFAHVNEISFGADLVALQYLKLFQEFRGRYYISSYCPAVIYYIEKYYPELIRNLAPIVTPAVATAKVLRKIHGYDVPIVLITPCFAAKRESDINRQRDSVIDYVLSFQEIRQMFAEAQITENSVPFSEFDPPIAHKGSLFPISRGMLQAVDINEDLLTGRILCTTGRENCISAIQEFKDHVEIKQHLDILYCDGCIMGPGMSKGGGKYLRRSLVINYVEKRLKNFVREQWEDEIKTYSELDLSRSFNKEDNQKPVSPDENTIKNILHKIGKSTKEEIIGCSACGYENCREFAKSIFFGYASPEMCRQYVYEKMRKSVEKLALTNEELSNTKAKLITSEQKAKAGEAMAEEVSESLRSMLKKIPMAIVMVNKNMRIIQTNQQFVNMFADKRLSPEELENKDIAFFLPFCKLFENLFFAKADSLKRDYDYNDKIYSIYVFNIQKDEIAGAIINDMSNPEILKTEVIEKAQDIIKKNMETVQQVAYLLGESTAKTEQMLHSIIRSHESGSKKEPNG